MLSLIKQKLKEKKAYSQSSEYIIFFTITVLLVIIMIQVLISLFTVYTANIAATNVARVVSVNGGFDSSEGDDIYEIADAQLKNRTIDGSITVSLSSTSLTTSDVILTNENQAKNYKVNLGEDFEVTVSAEVTLFTIAGRDINTTVSSTSSGVGEVYYKNG